MNEQLNFRPVRVGVVGCGAITQVHYAPALRELVRAGALEVCLLVDPSEESRTAVGVQFPMAHRAASLDFADGHIDATIVASPASMHAEHTTALLARGIHVLCEKPMALTVAQCEAMRSASQRARCLLAVGLFRRFFPATRQMRDLIASRALGDVRHFDIVEGNRFQWRARTDSFFRKSSGGGVLLDVGVHVLDLLLWWFGEPTDVTYEDDAMGGIEANCRLACSFSSGVTGSVRLSREWNLRNRYFVRFDHGWAAWDPAVPGAIELGVGERLALNARIHEARTVMGVAAVGPPAATYYESFTAQIENLVQAARGQAQLVVPADEGIRSIRLVERCYRDSRLMRMPWFSDLEMNSAQAKRC